ncbi:MAG: hypothetical protein Q7S77_02680 [Candidatus Staskawiczbacteria bacterium]|nr:hypothetical protein [Candidatus Staskawiczbacteria bacterium]
MSKQKREKIEFTADKKVLKPVKVEFYTKDGRKVSFRGHQEVTNPVKVEFYAKRDKKK